MYANWICGANYVGVMLRQGVSNTASRFLESKQIIWLFLSLLRRSDRNRAYPRGRNDLIFIIISDSLRHPVQLYTHNAIVLINVRIEVEKLVNIISAP